MTNLNWRMSVTEETANKKKFSKGGKGSWHDRLALPRAPAAPAAFVLLRAEYPDLYPDTHVPGKPPVMKPYYKFKKHRRKWDGNRFADEICSRGSDPYNPQPCAGCLAMDSGDKSVTLADTFAIPIFHLAKYHGHPIPNKEGSSWMTKQGSNEFVLGYDECTGRLCNYCRAMNGQAPLSPEKGKEQFPNYPQGSVTMVFGRRRYLELGKGHLSNMLGWDWIVSRNCGTCGSQMETTVYFCPSCENVLIDPSQDTRSDKEILEAATRMGQCPSCHNLVLPTEEQICPVCEKQGRQSAAQGIYDVVLLGQRQGEGTNSTMTLMGHKPIDRYGAEDIAADAAAVQAMGGRTLRQILSDVKEYDFQEMFTPKGLAEQAKRLGLDNIPGMGGGGGPGHAPWSSGPSPQGFSAPPRPNFGK